MGLFRYCEIFADLCFQLYQERGQDEAVGCEHGLRHEASQIPAEPLLGYGLKGAAQG